MNLVLLIWNHCVVVALWGVTTRKAKEELQNNRADWLLAALGEGANEELNAFPTQLVGHIGNRGLFGH